MLGYYYIQWVLFNSSICCHPVKIWLPCHSTEAALTKVTIDQLNDKCSGPLLVPVLYQHSPTLDTIYLSECLRILSFFDFCESPPSPALYILDPSFLPSLPFFLMMSFTSKLANLPSRPGTLMSVSSIDLAPEIHIDLISN